MYIVILMFLEKIEKNRHELTFITYRPVAEIYEEILLELLLDSSFKFGIETNRDENMYHILVKI